MATWDETKTGGGVNLLPVGIRNFEVNKAVAQVNDRTNRREVVLTLSSAAGSGEEAIPLEPWANDADSVELWEKIFKSAAAGLGFTPADGGATMQAITSEFALYAPSLAGAVVEADVKHIDSAKLKEDGTPFVNHRVFFRGVTTDAKPASEQFAAVGAAPTMDDVPW